MEDAGFIDAYLTSRRAQFVRIMGNTGGSRFTMEHEHAYIDQFVRPAAGPVLDLACGPGQYVERLTRKFGAARVLGLDLSFSMLEAAARVQESSNQKYRYIAVGCRENNTRQKVE